MVMTKPPISFCIDSFSYKKNIGINNWNEPSYSDPVFIDKCRIDRGAEFSSSTSGKSLLYNAVIFCYAGITTPLADFTVDSVVVYDGIDHVITKVIPVYEPFMKEIYSIEIEVV